MRENSTVDCMTKMFSSGIVVDGCIEGKLLQPCVTSRQSSGVHNFSFIQTGGQYAGYYTDNATDITCD